MEQGALQIVLGLDGKPSGRAVVDFGCHDVALQALSALSGGHRLVCGSLDSWPYEHPRERQILARPLRAQERSLLNLPPPPVGEGPALARFPESRGALDGLRKRRVSEPAENCEGIVKFFAEEKGYGFISTPNGDVFVHRSDCPDEQCLTEGQVVCFDVVQDDRGKTRATNLRIVSTSGPSSLSSPPLHRQASGGRRPQERLMVTQ